ncbi:MAG: M23 family metallopeptidase [Bacteroidota bacterium]|nr:M23 family metallopeptidase [Bacteroidota bacterium]MDX5404059.1 M23 family metallopeptidase [Bacteroidota bacterium]MDX5429152.1 M23 family metallopeptidase [Bacteroidota bacterium]MDX5448482.1 M23 family metallopeptidase [Bacteroidota bacterium]MDX5506790.1 M23 family metallopeptidase [Bacteroidota bacterium]
MAKVKYYYDTRTLSYRKIERTWRHRLREVGLFVLASALMGALFFFISDTYIDSPKEKRLKREVENMRLQYEIMDQRLNQLYTVLDDLQHRDDNIYRVIFEADPIPASIRNAGFGGANRYEKLNGFQNSDLIVNVARKLDIITKKMYVQSKSFDEVQGLAREKEQMLASIPAIQPVSNKDLKRIASGFGYRIHPIYKVRKLHAGIDFSAPRGTPIFATGDGVISNDREVGGTGYGKWVVIDHGYGYQTLYAHMSDVLVRRGQKVKRGDVIGYVGNTGQSTAPHLHYEVVKNGRKINPINFFYNDLSPEEYEIIVNIASQENQSFD